MLSSFGDLIFQKRVKAFLFKQPLHVRVEMGSDLQEIVFLYRPVEIANGIHPGSPILTFTYRFYKEK